MGWGATTKLLLPCIIRRKETQPYRYVWRFSDGTASEGKNVLHQFSDTGTYRAQLTTEIENLTTCSHDTAVGFKVRDEIYLPNVFTPNGDNVNDIYIVRYNGANKLDFQVFNRYGKPIFRQSAPVINWDGRTDAGNKLNTGVYYYIISSADGLVNKTGFIHLFNGEN
ncbi:MAG: T9SS type B sorting domain-containing protein [Bacteroidales bacterium]|nr:T9SS type B sorting domain-containing protein [Bacteroidales bacterium]